MRIIAGVARGIKLESLEGEEITRPTSDRVKEGLFNAIQFDISEKRVLDLFAGSGQLAIETLSRGASSAVLIDESDDAVQIMKKNAQKTNMYKKCRISRMDYSEYLKSVSEKDKFDIIFLDPPYSKDMANEILKKVSRANILNSNGLVICETNTPDNLTQNLHTFDFVKQYKYGTTYITIFIYKNQIVESNETEQVQETEQ